MSQILDICIMILAETIPERLVQGRKLGTLTFNGHEPLFCSLEFRLKLDFRRAGDSIVSDTEQLGSGLERRSDLRRRDRDRAVDGSRDDRDAGVHRSIEARIASQSRPQHHQGTEQKQNSDGDADGTTVPEHARLFGISGPLLLI